MGDEKFMNFSRQMRRFWYDGIPPSPLATALLIELQL